MKRKKQNIHLTIESRLIIEEMLNNDETITTIAKKLFRDRSNIGREIDKHKTIKFPSSFNRNNPCLYSDTCIRHYNIDCYRDCLDFIEKNPCPRLSESPHVCNGCNKKQCTHVKYYYNGKEANEQYINTLSESRKKMHYSNIELNILNNDFYNLVLQTKSIYHSLYVINSQGYNFNIKSIYRQIKAGYLRIKPEDLPRVAKKKEYKVIDKSYKRNIEGHSFEDYLEYKEKNQLAVEWQMDCVQGIQGSDEPVLLTLQIVKISFLFLFKINTQTANEVAKKLQEFKDSFNIEKFNKILDILLTDNGHEFINIEKLMNILPQTNIFYCHPYSSFEKGSIENNHELIRRVIPQGVSLKPYTQHDFDLLCSNINSLIRNNLDTKSPFDLVYEYIPKETLDKLNLKPIDPIKVTLIPELLGDKNIKNICKYLTEKDIEKAHIKFKK